MTDEEYLAWLIECAEGDLWHQVHEIFNQVHVYRSWNDIVGVAVDESRRPGLFHAWVLHNYLDSIAAGVRRLSDPDTRTNSLTRFLDELEVGAERLTYDWWMSAAVPGEKDVWEKEFQLVSRGGNHLDPREVVEDRTRVIAACDKVKGYVDTHIAHLDADRKDRIDLPTIGDVHSAIRVIYQVYHRWYEILTWKSLMPLQPPQWEHVPTVPWVSRDQAAQIAERRREEWKEDMSAMGITGCS